MRRWTITAALVALALPSALRAQDEWEAQVRDQLEAGGGSYKDRGYEMTHRIYMGSLNDGAKEIVELDLDTGWDYAVMGACDTDCGDLDLVLFAGTSQLDEDVEDDDFPIVTTTVSGAGGFKVEVRMEDCEKDPCRYGLGVWGKRSSASPSQASGRMSRVAPGTSSTASAAPRKAASAPDFNAAPSYGTITLSAGFEPDPSLRSISAGGADETSLGGDCSGFINAAAPDLDLNYTKGSYKLYIYAKSSSDITLIVNQPDGTWICNDDVNGSNPGLTIDNPQSGNYNIWIGTFEASRTPLPEAILYFSESEPRW